MLFNIQIQFNFLPFSIHLLMACLSYPIILPISAQVIFGLFFLYSQAILIKLLLIANFSHLNQLMLSKSNKLFNLLLSILSFIQSNSDFLQSITI